MPPSKARLSTLKRRDVRVRILGNIMCIGISIYQIYALRKVRKLYDHLYVLSTQFQVVKDTLCPVFKERFLFNIDSDSADQKTAYFQVFSCDKYARHKLLGETELRLGDVDFRRPLRVWMNLRDMDEVNQIVVFGILLNQ